MNAVFFLGRLTKEPEKTYTSTGMAVTQFTLAIDRYGKKGETDFIRIKCFDKAAENADKYLAKGLRVRVEGRVQTGSYKDKSGNTVYATDFIANQVAYIDWKQQDDSQPDREERKPDPAFAAAEAEIDSGTVPF